VAGNIHALNPASALTFRGCEKIEHSRREFFHKLSGIGQEASGIYGANNALTATLLLSKAAGCHGPALQLQPRTYPFNGLSPTEPGSDWPDRQDAAEDLIQGLFRGTAQDFFQPLRSSVPITTTSMCSRVAKSLMIRIGEPSTACRRCGGTECCSAN
jgi:hypothetical protein